MATVADVARRLNSGHPGAVGRPLPALVLMTDVVRLPDPVAAARRLPRGAAIILRHYDDPARERLALDLARACRRNRLCLLVAGDPRLAVRIGAAGVHWPEGLVAQARRARHWRPGWLFTAAAHGPAAMRRAARAGADAVLLSPVFPTASHPAARGIGLLRFVRWCRASPLPVFALGGIDARRAKRLLGSPACGIAGIGGLVEDARRPC